MTTDPGDLVLDPTCGSGTTAYVAEQWGRRWITIDTSRVALALARARIMGARYPYYLLADSREGQLKEAEITRRAPSETPTYGKVRQGLVYERVPHITLRSHSQQCGDRRHLGDGAGGDGASCERNSTAPWGTSREEWEIPRDADESWSEGGHLSSRPLVGTAHRPPEGDRRVESLPGLTSSTCTTSPTRTGARCASLAPSPWRAYRPTASWV